MGENANVNKSPQNDVKNSARPQYMPYSSAENGVKSAKAIDLEKIAESLAKSRREELLSGYDLKEFAKIFEDGNMMLTAETFISCGMNVSAAARKLYMHRNTLMYRLNIIYKKTGLDLRDFDMAVTFRLLHILYLKNKT